jgi:hypothetical protein
LPEEGLSDTHG